MLQSDICSAIDSRDLHLVKYYVSQGRLRLLYVGWRSVRPAERARAGCLDMFAPAIKT